MKTFVKGNREIVAFALAVLFFVFIMLLPGCTGEHLTETDFQYLPPADTELGQKARLCLDVSPYPKSCIRDIIDNNCSSNDTQVVPVPMPMPM